MTRDVLFPNYLMRLRRSRQLSQKRLAYLVGTSVGAISDYERGRRLPTAAVGMRLEIVLSAKLSEMYVQVYQQFIAQVVAREDALPGTSHDIRDRHLRKD